MSTIAADRVGAADGAFFHGYHRTDGCIGVRNHLLVLSTVALTNRWAALAAAGRDDAVVVAGDFLRGLRGGDAALQDDVLARLATHPNVGAVLILCFDRAAAADWHERMTASGRPATVLSLMAQPGMAGAVAAAQAALDALEVRRNAAARAPAPLSALTLALECGGSDATSAICANPAIGRFVERLIGAGGAAIISETAEFIGAEDVVRQRAVTLEVARRVLACIDAAEARTAEDGERYRGVNPTQENIEAGLTTLVEKSMGAVCKIGDLAIDGCLGFAEPPPAGGLYFMDTPFFSPVSLTGMVAAGAQITLFALGVFNPSGNPLAPTVKICGNGNTLAVWGDSIDIGLAELVARRMTLDEAAALIAATTAEIAGGAPSRAEHWGEGQIIIPKTSALI
jgi:altronate dehydratase large subunit